MNWGKAIILVFIVFALFIGGLVTICARQQIGLVSKDYYSQELKYQEQIDQTTNTLKLASKPTLIADGGVLELRYPDLTALEDGRLHLIRPSDSNWDRMYKVVATSDSSARFDASSLPAGKYNVKLTWRMNDRKFLLEQTIIL